MLNFSGYYVQSYKIFTLVFGSLQIFRTYCRIRQTKWQPEVACMLQIPFVMCVGNLSRLEPRNTLLKHLLRCVKPTKHILVCQSVIKTGPGHHISHVSTARKLLKVREQLQFIICLLCLQDGIEEKRGL